LPASGIFRGYNAVDNQHFASASHWRAQGDSARITLGLPPRYLLAVSRFTLKKNLSTLIEGFARWRQLQSAPNRDLQLLILGDGPLRPALEAQVEALGLQGVVTMPGPCSYADLPGRYGLAEGFIHASTVEQWGLVVNEAMAASLPVLVSKACGCAPQLVHSGINGLRFDPGSPKSLAEAIDWLVSLDSVQRRNLGRASNRVVSGFGPEAFATGLTAAANHARLQRISPLHRFDQLLLTRLMRRSGGDE
jgi:glycosyltransferase involved in cell wall biosynthesis